MAITTIPWGDGSGDNIYLSAPSQTGDQSVSVTSDPNTGAARSKVVTLSAVGVTPVSLTINQAGVPQQYTLELNPSSYIPKAEDGEWYGLSNASNAYNPADNTTYAMIRLTRGSAEATTHIYFCFDTSSIPANATINSVECKVKVFINNATSSNVATKQVQMFSGTTPMGSSQNATTSASVKTFSGVTWTREQLNDVRIRLYGVRGTNNVNSDYYFRLYGATLTIKYQI
ncbi:MAG: hypothetical protein IKD95_06810 [Bacteroidales bacterium]|nr:hypothetical protein [Bacteroidales bacterium]